MWTLRGQDTEARDGSGASEVGSRLIEAAGTVEFRRSAGTNWFVAPVGLSLFPGDKLRTHTESRAAVQLSDRSVMRLNERTTLEILAPAASARKRFGLPAGSLFFFNREKPADVEFETPLAAGAIRGTEFVLEVGSSPSSLYLALMDGLVGLRSVDGDVSLAKGEQLLLQPGFPPKKSPLLNARTVIQWALHYPAVLNPQDLNLSSDNEAHLHPVLEFYRQGDLLQALEAWPARDLSPGDDWPVLRAQLLLAVGGVPAAEALLNSLPQDQPAVAALRELISVVRGDAFAERPPPGTASEWLARSYTCQAQADLTAALTAARAAAQCAPELGFARVRVAELEFAFRRRTVALAELKAAKDLSPRLPTAFAVEGFVLLDEGKVRPALVAFDQARSLDAGFSLAWLGRGLCLIRDRQYAEARYALQAAAALDPQRAVFRTYLGKAEANAGQGRAAEKEFRLAKELDPEDPTAWLYASLNLWQENRINEAIRDLEQSYALNDQLAPFRSRLWLDADRSVRSANLAAMYGDAGLTAVSVRLAQRAVAESHANFSGHLFLADSYREQSDVNRLELRYETAAQSELLVANLLAPPGGGNLSQVLSQHEQLRFFDPQPVAVSSLTEYGSGGDWSQVGSVFGAVGGLGYAFDTVYQSFNGDHPNGEFEQLQFVATVKQRVSPKDELYLQAGRLELEAGAVGRYYDPATADPDFVVREIQEPTLHAGWHHAWAPGHHTLLLFSRLDDRLSLNDDQISVPFLRQTGGVIAGVDSTLPMDLAFESDVTLYSAEVQQIWETPRQSVVLGGRWQSADVNAVSTLTRGILGVFLDQEEAGTFERGDLYAYATWRVTSAISVMGGVTYSHIEFPENADYVPISMAEETRDLVAPKVGLLLRPWDRARLRASYTRSMGGLYFDNSVRLEPTQVGGFNQAYRSLVPESAAGPVPAAEFETIGLGFDQSLARGTWFGIELEQLDSDGDRRVGVLTNSTPLPLADSPSTTRQTLDFRERSLTAYAGQLVGDHLSLGARYRLSRADLAERSPEIPDTAVNRDRLEQDVRATLHQLSLTATVHQRCGFFAQWESVWLGQSNEGYSPALEDDSFWQHNVRAGYRLWRRRLELSVGVLNLTGEDYRLNPLNPHARLPRHRTFVTSLRLNF